jgi:hypothetical protein
MAAADGELMRATWHNIVANPAAYSVPRARALPHLVLTSFDWFTGPNMSFANSWRARSWGLLALKLSLLVAFSALPLGFGLVGLSSRDQNAAVLCATAWVFTALIHAPMWIEYRFWPRSLFLLVTASFGRRLAMPGVG